jgi:peptidyl serine alpha-galactosyltransferase
LGFPDSPENEDAIIILMDPDQILLRPFTNDFTGSSEVWRSTGGSKVPSGNKVKHGSPFAQQYGYGLQWKTKVNMTHVAAGKPSRIDGMDMEEAKAHYSLGPPYIATAKDMYAIAETWCEFCVSKLRLDDEGKYVVRFSILTYQIDSSA